MDIAEGVLGGSRLALSKAITAIENEHEDAVEIMRKIYPHTGNAYVIGITGPPGAGKSTLTDKLAKEYRKRNKTVGIVAIDLIRHVRHAPDKHGRLPRRNERRNKLLLRAGGVCAYAARRLAGILSCHRHCGV